MPGGLADPLPDLPVDLANQATDLIGLGGSRIRVNRRVAVETETRAGQARHPDRDDHRAGPQGKARQIDHGLRLTQGRPVERRQRNAAHRLFVDQEAQRPAVAQAVESGFGAGDRLRQHGDAAALAKAQQQRGDKAVGWRSVDHRHWEAELHGDGRRQFPISEMAADEDDRPSAGGVHGGVHPGHLDPAGGP